MTYEESIELFDKIKGMSRSQLVRLHYRALRKLDTLSRICDVDDVYKAITEQQSAQEKVEKLNSRNERLGEQVIYAKRYMIQALRKRGVECDKTFTLPQLTDLMIESDKESINQ